MQWVAITPSVALLSHSNFGVSDELAGRGQARTRDDPGGHRAARDQHDGAGG